LIWSQGSKRRFWKNEKYPQVFIQSISVVNFNMMGPFFASQRCPRVFGHGSKNDFNDRRYSSNLQLCQMSTWLCYFWLF